MSYSSIFLVSFTIAFTGALAPGPLLTAVISESTKRGFKAGPLIILGHAVIEVVMVALLISGIAYFIHNPVVLKIISVLGISILLYFGGSMLWSIPKLSLDFSEKGRSPSNLTLLGITMSLANPYWTIWWLTIGLGLVLGAQKQGFLAVVVFFAGHIMADFVTYCSISLAISRGRKYFSLKLYKTIIAGCGLALILFAIWFTKEL